MRTRCRPPSGSFRTLRSKTQPAGSTATGAATPTLTAGNTIGGFTTTGGAGGAGGAGGSFGGSGSTILPGGKVMTLPGSSLPGSSLPGKVTTLLGSSLLGSSLPVTTLGSSLPVVFSFFTAEVVVTVLTCLMTTGDVRTAENERAPLDPPPPPDLARASVELRVTVASAAIARLESMRVFMVRLPCDPLKSVHRSSMVRRLSGLRIPRCADNHSDDDSVNVASLF